MVAALTLAVVGHVTQVITTPNAAFFTFSLANGANSAPIAPVTNQSVLVMGSHTTVGNWGTGHVTMLPASPAPNNFLEWTGLESPCFCGPATITFGFSSAPGAHIVFLDFGHFLDIQVHTADTFVVHNATGGTATGNVTLIW